MPMKPIILWWKAKRPRLTVVFSCLASIIIMVLLCYSGYLHCDMWRVYQQLPKAILVGCWAHVRRKFFEAVLQNASEKSLTKQGVRYCNQMFQLEKAWELLSNENRYQASQEKLKPLFKEFFD